MKDPTNQNNFGGDEDVRLPWKTELNIKDLVNPITVRRIKIFQVLGIFLLVLGIGFFAWWWFVKPP